MGGAIYELVWALVGICAYGDEKGILDHDDDMSGWSVTGGLMTGNCMQTVVTAPMKRKDYALMNASSKAKKHWNMYKKF